MPQKQKRSRTQNQIGFYKCKKSNCYPCKFSDPSKTITSRNTAKTFDIKQKIDCETKNVLYRIQCQKCGKEYIGETGRNVKVRIKEHLDYVKNKNVKQPTGAHFNKKGHGLEYFSWVAFEKINKSGPNYRKTRESFRINQFNTTEPNGMNKE